MLTKNEMNKLIYLTANDANALVKGKLDFDRVQELFNKIQTSARAGRKRVHVGDFKHQFKEINLFFTKFGFKVTKDADGIFINW